MITLSETDFFRHLQIGHDEKKKRRFHLPTMGIFRAKLAKDWTRTNGFGVFLNLFLARVCFGPQNDATFEGSGYLGKVVFYMFYSHFLSSKGSN